MNQVNLVNLVEPTHLSKLMYLVKVVNQVRDTKKNTKYNNPKIKVRPEKEESDVGRYSGVIGGTQAEADDIILPN